MTDQNIRDHIAQLKKQISGVVRVKGDKKNPPKPLSFNFSGLSYTPHVEVQHEYKTDFYEYEKKFIEVKLSEMMTKWILFSIKAKMCSGEFFLVVDENEKLRFQDIVTIKKLDVVVIGIP